MNNNNSNKISIFIAIIAAVLILGGVYLLNQNINSQNQSQNTSLSSISRSSLNIIRSSASSSLFFDISSQISNSSISSISSLSSSSLFSSSSESSSSESSQSSSLSSSISSFSSESSSSASILASDEVKIRVISRNGTAYQLEVIDSGIPNSKFFKAGAKITKITITGFDLKEGGSYLMNMTVEETADSFKITSIKSATPL